MVGEAFDDEAWIEVGVVVVVDGAAVVGGVVARDASTGSVVELVFRAGLVVDDVGDPDLVVGPVLVKVGARGEPVGAVVRADTACGCETALAELAAIAEPSTTTVVAAAATTRRVVLASTPCMSD